MSPARGDRYGRPRPVDGGVKARSARGGFGRTWWGKAFIEAVEAMSEPGRLARGRSYARAGQVVSYRIGAGSVVAEVQGSQPRPFTAEFTVRRLREEELELLVETIRDTPGMLADIASGSVVAEVQGSQPRPFTAEFTVRRLREEELELLVETIRDTPGMLADIASGVLPPALGPHLLPTTAADLDFSCTCPDPGWPCKHAAAVCYLLAERLDEAPREILTLRGLDLDTLIGGLEREPSPESDDDPYGERGTLPALPRLEFHAAPDDLDPVLLRKAARMVSEDETAAATAVRELEALYERLDRT
ncbi:SWIM zinc finger family protein [Nocardia farcinica]|uniref:SWIM zinc finger family protein n=1 Tax=Nocardia farcinica TaxID=37329 RepID=UPI002B4B697B|nr:SWIM zinc finger family protein [Nocardia farcinica]